MNVKVGQMAIERIGERQEALGVAGLRISLPHVHTQRIPSAPTSRSVGFPPIWLVIRSALAMPVQPLASTPGPHHDDRYKAQLRCRVSSSPQTTRFHE